MFVFRWQVRLRPAQPTRCPALHTYSAPSRP
jgi:hypothetical protein